MTPVHRQSEIHSAGRPARRWSFMAMYCITVLAFLLSTGCQNTLRVKVELMAPRPPKDAGQKTEPTISPPDGWTQARIARGKAAIRSAISTIEDGVEAAKQSLRALGYNDAVIDGGQFPNFALLKKACDSARTNLEKLNNFGQNATTTTNWSDIATVLQGMELQFRTDVELALQRFDSLKQQLDQLDRHATPTPEVRAKLDAVTRSLDLLEKGAKESAVKVAVAGFGGFEVLGVHQINMGDVEYRRVLNRRHYEPVGVFSQAVAAVNGDSTIVIVQENPGQFRIFEIDNDPTKLIQNVAYVSNKALEAAVKYAAP